MEFTGTEVISFDCYGTLIDWETGIVQAVCSALPDLNRTKEDILRAYSEIEPAVQSGRYRPYRDVLVETLKQMRSRFGCKLTDEAALANSLPGWRPFPDTVPALRRLRERYRLAIISNIDRNLFSATAVRLEVPFDFVVTAEGVGSYKPSLQNFTTAVQRFGVPPARLLHVGESLFHDIAPAEQLGIPNVWVNRREGRQGASALAGVRARATVRNLAELAEILLGR